MMLRYLLLLILSIFSLADVRIIVASAEGASGERVVIDIFAEGVEKMAGIQFSLHFNPSVVKVVDVSKGELISEFLLDKKIDNERGIVKIAAVGPKPVNGSGTIAKISFELKGLPGDKTKLEIKDLLISDDGGNSINAVITHGSISIITVTTYKTETTTITHTSPATEPTIIDTTSPSAATTSTPSQPTTTHVITADHTVVRSRRATSPQTSPTPTTTLSRGDAAIFIALTVVIIAFATTAFLLVSYKKRTAGPLVLLELPGGRIIPIVSYDQIFGRGDFAAFLPPDATRYISAKHFRIFYHSGQWYVEDLGSTNGTLVNGIEIKGRGPVPIKDGAEISPAGVVILKFRLKDYP